MSPRRIITTAAAAVVVAVVFLAGRMSVAGPHRVPSPAAHPTAPQPEAPTGVAQRLVRQLNDPLLTTAERSRLLGEVTAPGAADLLTVFAPGPGFEQATGIAVDTAAHRPVIAVVVPVRAQVVSQDAGDVRVAVWAVTVVGTHRLGQLLGSWSTETVELRRSAAGWLLTGYRSTPGPVPVSTQPPTPVATALAALTLEGTRR